MKETRVLLEDEWFTMEEGTIENYSRILHMKDGVLKRSLVWTSPRGRKAEIRFQRLVSFEMKNIMAIRVQVTPLNFSGKIQFRSRLQADVENHTRKTNPIVDYGPFGRRLEPLRLEGKDTACIMKGLRKTAGSPQPAGAATGYPVADVRRDGSFV